MEANATGEADSGSLRLQFDRSVKLAFHGSALSSDGGLLLHRELDDALCLTDMAAVVLTDTRTGQNGRHREYLKAWGNHMLQIRTRTLDGTLRTKFEQWYPGMKPAAADRVAA